MEDSDRTNAEQAQGLLAELANQHTQTPKAVIRLQPQPLSLAGKPSTVIMRTGSPVSRAGVRSGRRDV
jgi:hypothetical protein